MAKQNLIQRIADHVLTKQTAPTAAEYQMLEQELVKNGRESKEMTVLKVESRKT